MYFERILIRVSPCLTVIVSVLKVSITIPNFISGDLMLKLLKVEIIFLLYLADGSKLFGRSFDRISDDNINVKANPVCFIKLLVFTGF